MYQIKAKIFVVLNQISSNPKLDTMRRLLLITILMLNGIFVFSQIALEKSISSYKTCFSSSSYALYKDTIGTVYLYNYNHALTRTVTLSIPSGYSIYTFSYLSKNVFDLDNNYEFFVVFMTRKAPFTSKAYIINEDGSVLKGFGPYNAYIYAFIENTTNGNKLIVGKYNNIGYDYDIYSLPSSGTTEIKGENIESISAYPNPTDGMVKLSGTSGEITVFSINGTKIGIFNSEVIDLSGLPSGMYLLKQREQTIKVILK